LREAFVMEKKPSAYQPSLPVFFKRFCIIACLTLLVLWSQSSCAESIKIGGINPLSGRLAKHGLEILQGIAVAVSEVNESGGIGGRPLQLISRDDQSRPDVAISRAEELCGKSGVVALTGGYVDSLVGPISEVARKYKTPYVASASLQKELVQQENPYFFRVSHLRGFTAPICSFLVEHLRPLRPAILHAATPGSTEMAQDIKLCLQSHGIAVPLIEKFRPGTPDFTPLIAKLSDMEIDVIISGGFFPDHILMVRQLKENRVSPKAYIGPWGIAYESFMREMSDDANFLYGTCAWNPGINQPGTEAASEAFVEKFRHMFNRQPNTTNMHGYTSARVLISAIQQVLHHGQSLTGENLRKALTGIDMVLPMERIAFDRRGDPRYYRHVVVQIQKNKLEVVYPFERATNTAIYPMPSWDQRK